MKLTCKTVDAFHIQSVLSSIGPLDTLFCAAADLHVEIWQEHFAIQNKPVESELAHHINSQKGKPLLYKAYKAAVIRMLAEHNAVQAVRGTGLQPLGAINGNEILLHALRFHGGEYNDTIAMIRRRSDFSHWKRQDDRLPPGGKLGGALLSVNNNGLNMQLVELHHGDLNIQNKGELSIKTALPASIGNAVIGRQLRDVVSHPMLDGLDIEIVNYDDEHLYLKDRIVSALPRGDDSPEFQEATRQYEEWEKTWDSGRSI